jgi:hypothetical protein
MGAGVRPGRKTKPVLVEVVKPITHFDQEIGRKITNALAAKQAALLVGCTLPDSIYCSDDHQHPCVEWLRESWPGPSIERELGISQRKPRGHRWELAPFAWYTSSPRSHDFCSERGWWRGRLTDEYDGGGSMCYDPAIGQGWGWALQRVNEVNNAWGEAGSIVRWHKDGRA